MIRRHSGSARLPSPRIGSPNSATRVIPSGTFSVSLRSRPTTMLAVFCPYGRVDRDEFAVLVEVVLDELPGWEPRDGLGRRGQHPHDLVRVRHAESVGAQQLLVVRRQRPDRLLARRAFAHRHAAAQTLQRRARGRGRRGIAPAAPLSPARRRRPAAPASGPTRATRRAGHPTADGRTARSGWLPAAPSAPNLASASRIAASASSPISSSRG